MMVFRLPWWRHQMETFSALLALCAGNSLVSGEFPAQRPVTRSFDVFFDLRPNKRLSKQSWGWWFETLLSPLWCHRNGSHAIIWTICWPFVNLTLRNKKMHVFGWNHSKLVVTSSVGGYYCVEVFAAGMICISKNTLLLQAWFAYMRFTVDLYQ